MTAVTLEHGRGSAGKLDSSVAGAGKPGTWAVVGVSLASLAAGTFAIVAFGVLAPELRTDLGLSRAEIGFLTSLVFIGAMATSWAGGRLTDSFGPALVLGASMAAFAGGMALAALAPTGLLLMSAALVAGLAYGGVNPPTNAVIASRLKRRLGFFLSLKQTGVPLGGLVAGIVFPPIAVAFGWRYAFAVAVVVCLVAAASTLLLRGGRVRVVHARPLHGRLAHPRELAAVGFFGFIMAGTQWTLLTYMTLYLTGDGGFSLGKAGLALALLLASGAAGRLLWGWLSDTPGRRLTILLVIAASATGFLALLGVGPLSVLVWPLCVLAGLAIVGWNGAYYALIADWAGPGRVGRASGESLMFIFAGSVVLPPLMGLLVDSVDAWEPLWILNAALVAVAGLVLWASLRASSLSLGASARPSERSAGPA